ncbi:MAG TPA: NIL domain-containing protein [Candidatus Binatia bacterium]|nr:NIL domain-containing protein [Candidatus Binatia bacterium]
MKAVRSKPLSSSRSVREKVYLTYPPKLLKEPIIYQLGQKFRVVTNIRGANISAEVGLVALEVDGAESEVSAALRWLAEIGVTVEPIEKNVIE